MPDRQEKLMNNLQGQSFEKITIWGEMPNAGVILSVDTDFLPNLTTPFQLEASISGNIRINGEAILKTRNHPDRGEYSKLYILVDREFLNPNEIDRDATIRIENVSFEEAPSKINQITFN